MLRATCLHLLFCATTSLPWAGAELMSLFFCPAEAVGWGMTSQNNVGERNGHLLLPSSPRMPFVIASFLSPPPPIPSPSHRRSFCILKEVHTALEYNFCKYPQMILRPWKYLNLWSTDNIYLLMMKQAMTGLEKIRESRHRSIWDWEKIKRKCKVDQNSG